MSRKTTYNTHLRRAGGNQKLSGNVIFMWKLDARFARCSGIQQWKGRDMAVFLVFYIYMILCNR